MPTVNSNGTPIYYESQGGGPAIVFAHGAGGNAAIWFNQIAHFSDRYQCISFDHRCFARSPADPDSVTIPNFRDDLLTIMDTLEVESAHLVGQSMGGFTVLRCALDSPDRVITLTMSCTPGGAVIPEPTEAVQQLGTRGADGIKATMAKKTFENPALVQLYSAIQSFNTEFSFAKLKNLRRPEDVIEHERLAAVKCPTLFVSGREDPLFLPEQLSALVPHFPDARIEIVEDSGHSPYFERPDVFNALLESHIESASR
jgi:3-oxoadipate enol-lactonase